MGNRITREDLYMGIANLFSKRSTCRRLQVGCTIVKDGRVICSGYNGSLKSNTSIGDVCRCSPDTPCSKAIHAEANAISFAAKQGIKLDGAFLYCTHSPCLKCAELIIQAGIKVVQYGEVFRDREGLDLLMTNGVNINKYENQI